MVVLCKTGLRHLQHLWYRRWRQGLHGHMATRDVGAPWGLGGGRQRPAEAPICASALTLSVVGSPVSQGDSLARVHARTHADAERATRTFLNAVTIVDDQPEVRPIVLDTVRPLTVGPLN